MFLKSAIRNFRILRPIPVWQAPHLHVQSRVFSSKNDLFTFDVDLPNNDHVKSDPSKNNRETDLEEAANSGTLKKEEDSPLHNDLKIDPESELQLLDDLFKDELQLKNYQKDEFKDDLLFKDMFKNIKDENDLEKDSLSNDLFNDSWNKDSFTENFTDEDNMYFRNSSHTEVLEDAPNDSERLKSPKLNFLSKYELLLDDSPDEKNGHANGGSKEQSVLGVLNDLEAKNSKTGKYDLLSKYNILPDFDVLCKDNEHVKNNEKQFEDDFSDILSDIVVDPNTNENGTSELDRIFSDLAKGSHTKSEFPTINIENPEEEIADQPLDDVLSEEKRLFDSIFETYTRLENNSPSPKNLEAEVLWNLQQSFIRPGKASETVPYSREGVSAEEVRKCLTEAKTAIQPTLDLILLLEKPLDLLLFWTNVLDRYQTHDYDKQAFYLHKDKSESKSAFAERKEEVFKKILCLCAESPKKPPLHEYTLAVLFNHIVRLCTVKFYNGRLALSLFNSLKKDLSLYTVTCNQDTYNEMIKVYWIFMGKSSLCEIELLIVEMMNNGFPGDLATFTILKEVMGEYHTMRMGKSLYNPGGLPIWSFEDEKRASKLGAKLRELGKNLRKA